MGFLVPFAPYLLAFPFSFFFFRYGNYFFRETQTNQIEKNKLTYTSHKLW